MRTTFTALLHVSVAAAAFLAFAWPFTVSRDQDSAAYHVIAVGVLLVFFASLAMLHAKFAGRSPLELFGVRTDRWFAGVVQQGSDRPGVAAKPGETAVRRRVPLRLIIWILVVLVTIAVLAPLGFRPYG